MYVHHMHAGPTDPRSQNKESDPLVVKAVVNYPGEEPNPGPLEEQQELFTIVISLVSWSHIFLY